MSVLTGAAQIQSSWAKIVESYDRIPEAYQPLFQTLSEPGTEKFPYIILIPSYQGHLNPTEDSLIVCFDRRFYIMERHLHQLECLCYSYSDVSYVEMGTVLLKSWITASGISSEGFLGSFTLKFNTAKERLFTPLLEKLRPAPLAAGDTDLGVEQAKFDLLEQENYKFFNYARGSIRAGEKVIQTVLQPELRVEVFTFLGRTFYRSICPAHISILTDLEFIVIRDEFRTWRSGYGNIWRYIPLDKIVSVSLARQEHDLVSLSIHLPRNEQFDLLFSSSRQGEIEAFKNQLATLANTVRG